MSRKRVKKKDKYPTVYSTKFIDNLKISEEKCFVPLSEYRDLERRYLKMFNRYQGMKFLWFRKEKYNKLRIVA